ncbi:MAG: hypothetical protein AB7T49_19165 [Oligoflexales bacterium]
MRTHALIIAVGLLVACGKGSEKKSTSDKGFTKGSLNALLGSWESACINDAESEGSQQFVLNIAEAEYQITNETFADSNCANKDLVFEQTGTYTDKNSTIQIKPTEVFYTYVDAATVSYLNQSKFCGKNDWKTNQRTKVDALACGGDVIDASTSTYKIEGDSLSLTSEGETTKLRRRK